MNDDLIKLLVQIGAEEAAEKLRDLDTNDPVIAAALAIVADKVEKHGVEGFLAAEALLRRLFETPNLDDLEGVPLRARSDLLVVMEQDEAANRKKARVALDAIGSVIGAILLAVVKTVRP